MITEQMYKRAREVMRLYELQSHKLAVIKSLPILEDGMILEYRDLTGRWYEYTKDLQENIYFEPIQTRVRMISNIL